jgi:hypothetical protein
MATREKSRRFDHAAGAVIVMIEDDFGAEMQIVVHLEGHSCPMCGRELPRDVQGDTDVNEHVDQVLQERDSRTERLIKKFEKHGADMSAVKAKRGLSKGNHSAGS